MNHPIPPGTRDVLPDEMRELRAISSRMRATFEDAGYGEVHTPALEYEEVLRRGEEHAAGARYRTFDEQGDVLALRSDMTIPIARVVGTRYADAEPPFRFCYFSHAWRAVERGVGEPREFLQGGLELIGAEGPEGDAEVVALTIEALDAVGLRRHRIGIGDGSLYRTLLKDLDVPEERHMPLLECLSRRDLVGLDRLVADLPERELLLGLPEVRGGPEVLERAEGLRALHDLLDGARRGRSRDLRPRPRARARLLHRRGVRGVRPRRRLRARRRRALRRAAGALRPRAARLWRGARPAARAPGPGGRGGAGVSGLTIAVPRGALFGDTLDLLDALGVDTAEVRTNDRRLLFAEAGIVTMRPSDVPTYVEHGSADIGVTGKDVLLEQSHRNVYELVDLGYGRCRMVVAAGAGDPIGAALRRLGRVRIATKYPRVAARHFADTGRQAEIVEVKGSVELAPLTGLVDGIVDLTATGRTLDENGLRVVEEIGVCTARLIANPVAHKLKAAEIDAIVERIRA